MKNNKYYGHLLLQKTLITRYIQALMNLVYEPVQNFSLIGKFLKIFS